MSKKKASRKAAVRNADLWMSRYVRRKAANNQGNARCFTCGRIESWKELQCGHFQTRSKYSVRWLERNTAPQCVRCNISNGGQQYQFGVELDRKHGAGTAEEILIQGNELRKFTTDEILQIAADYRTKYNAL
jgi:hypothetical protein